MESETETSDAEEMAREAAKAQKEMMAQHRDAATIALFVKMQEVMNGMSSPKDIEYDENGLMKAIGGKPVVRDANGRVARIG